MLSVQNIAKSYGVQTILHDVSFVLNYGERIGLVGPNGCGKSTLLRIIAGEERADSGSVHVSPGARLGYLPQAMTLGEQDTVFEAVRSGHEDWNQARRQVDRFAARLAAGGDEGEQYLEQYGDALARFESLGGYAVEHRIEAILAGLGFPLEKLRETVEHLSGGQRARVNLARVLLPQPDFLLLDEPTNHLDIEALEWLESFLKTFPGGILMVSHDRVFLENTVDRIAAHDERGHTVRLFTGGYQEYKSTIARELEKTWQSWQDQETEIRRMRADIHKTKMHAKSVELTTTSRQPTVRRYAKKVAKKARSREKKLDRYLDSEERVDKPKKGWNMNLVFDEDLRSGQQVCEMFGLGHGYVEGSMLFMGLDKAILYGERIALTGPNGSGKSTLLKILIGEIEPLEGRVSLGAGVRIGYMPQEQETLDPERTPAAVIQDASPMSETEARNFLHQFLIAGDAAVQPCSTLSFGERSRLILARLVVSGANFLILDEPLNHLDIPSRERFEAALGAFPGTVLATVHDRAFLAKFPQKIWQIEGGILAEWIVRPVF